MCGINGIISLKGEPANHRSDIERMNAALAHRGPDDAGVYFDDRATLGHRRLSIIDLSSAGQQPMLSANNRYVIVFNGEIYNFRELRPQLDYPFKSNTDTEVLLAAWQIWGPKCIDLLIGMFAFAIWDCQKSELYLVRDRLGVKPLYYYQDEHRIIFSSEVRGVLASQLLPAAINSAAIVDYLRYQCVHQPDTIVDGARLLAPGSYLHYENGRTGFHRYWSPIQPKTGKEPNIRVSAETARRCVLDALQRAVERRMVADVPFGAFLSGGIDSSAIVALMSRFTDKVSTFSISFAEKEFSEARYARMVADKYRTDHHEIQLTPDDFLELLPEALDRMDHPSGDCPNTYVVSKVTKEAGITMALSGLGGDELFAGYPVFTQGMRLEKMRWLDRIPNSLRKNAGHLIHSYRSSIATAKIAAILAKPRISALSAYPLYRQVFMDDQIAKMMNNEKLPPNRVEQLLADLCNESGFNDMAMLSRISISEITTYMQHVLLRDTDQMSMAHALEVRVPFLDHELVELVLGLPDELKYSRAPKQLLVESLGDLLPAEIVNRPKMGFTLPYAQWMKTSLRAFCEERVQRLSERGLFNGPVIIKYWQEFLEGKPAISWSRMWMMVVLEHWLEKNSVN